jgi:hypothetical protein
VVTNPWTGDAARLAGERAWILVDGFSREAYTAAARELAARLQEPAALRQAAGDLARRHFSLGEAVGRYDALYRRVLGARA